MHQIGLREYELLISHTIGNFLSKFQSRFFSISSGEGYDVGLPLKSVQKTNEYRTAQSDDCLDLATKKIDLRSVPSQYPTQFTFAWLTFSLLWAARAIVSRWGRKYSNARTPAQQNKIFKPISYIVFFIQLFLVPALFWFDSPLFLRFHESDFWKLIGLSMCFSGLFLYLIALRSLGRNYSPCFDSHIPFEIVESGPYRLVRHPTWLAKFLVSFGALILSGSTWVMLIPLWIAMEFWRTVPAEEADLMAHFPQYAHYRNRTSLVVPFLY